MYDNNNVFAKIIRGEIPCNKIYENQHAMSFYDANPTCDIHVLIIPKGPYKNILEFTQNATCDENSGFWECFNKTTETLGISNNFNVLSNAGKDAPMVSQSVPHFHMHVMAGKRIKKHIQ